MPRTAGAHTRVWQRQPRARDRIWAAMRVMRRFSVPDLAAAAVAGTDNVSKYVRGLLRAGYVRVAREKQQGLKGGHTIYRLVANAGPKAPRLQSDGSTYDPNQHQTTAGGLPQ